MIKWRKRRSLSSVSMEWLHNLLQDGLLHDQYKFHKVSFLSQVYIRPTIRIFKNCMLQDINMKYYFCWCFCEHEEKMYIHMVVPWLSLLLLMFPKLTVQSTLCRQVNNTKRSNMDSFFTEVQDIFLFNVYNKMEFSSKHLDVEKKYVHVCICI